MTKPDIYAMMGISTGLPRSLFAAFSRAYPGQSPDVFVRSPGRVNLLGGHVDIHDGVVINIAINREIWLAAAYGTADLVRLDAADLGAATALSLRRLDERVDVVGEPLPRWAQYPAGVAWALQRRGLRVNGVNAVFTGSIPMRAGLSSSAAVEVSFLIAWQALESWRLNPQEVALVGREVEREYLKVGTGVQDQFTCLNARQGHALWLDCRTLEHRCVLLPPQASVVVCDTNTRRELVSSSYNQRAQDVHSTARTISLLDAGVKTLRDVTLDRLYDFQNVLTEGQFRRSRHVITEIARAQQGLDALQRNDLAAFGTLMRESYHSARDDYGSSSPALDAMCQAANDHPACYGARYTGGGEAGAAVALVETAAVEEFIAVTGARYQQQTGQAGTLFAVAAVDGAGVFI